MMKEMTTTHTRRMPRRAGGAVRALAPVAGIVLLAPVLFALREPDPAREGLLTLNALDHRLNIYDFRAAGLGFSRQYDDTLREFVGDVIFDGQELAVIENDRYTGVIIDLGEGKLPDTEFSLYYSLRLYKRGFQVRDFPFRERYLPYDGIEPNSFFGRPRDPTTAIKVALGHTYLLRLHHRTTTLDERFYLVKVIEHTPGLKMVAIWREIVNHREA
jgi:hypothetical protein